jgi:hypothetical protein
VQRNPTRPRREQVLASLALVKMSDLDPNLPFGEGAAAMAIVNYENPRDSSSRPPSHYAGPSVVWGIASIFLFFMLVPGILAMFFGWRALHDTEAHHQSGRNSAWAGLWLGAISTFLFFVSVFYLAIVSNWPF